MRMQEQVWDTSRIFGSLWILPSVNLNFVKDVATKYADSQCRTTILTFTSIGCQLERISIKVTVLLYAISV